MSCSGSNHLIEVTCGAGDSCDRDQGTWDILYIFYSHGNTPIDACCKADKLVGHQCNIGPICDTAQSTSQHRAPH